VQADGRACLESGLSGVGGGSCGLKFAVRLASSGGFVSEILTLVLLGVAQAVFCWERALRVSRAKAHRWRSMRIKRFLTILRDLFLPQRRNACPHCGGVHCIGACQFDSGKPRTATMQSSQPQKKPDTAAEHKS